MWKQVKGYEGIYEVSDSGQIRRVSAKRGTTIGHVFNPSLDNKGYYRTRLTDANGKGKTVKVHRIVAEAFLDNPDNKPHVNHKDGNKVNNHVSNLEWATAKENSNHAWDNGLIKPAFLGKFGKDHNKSLKIRLKHKSGEIREFFGLNEASRELNTNPAALWRVRKGEYKHTKGWSFC